MAHHNICPLCDSENVVHFLQTRDYFLTREPFELFKCSGCGFIFTQDYPEPDNMNRYYESDDYISHNDSARGLLNNLYRISRSFMLRRKKSIVRRHTRLGKGNLLDIGSGTGHFISFMKKAGWEVKGIEINDKAREFSVSHFGLEVIPKELISSLASGSFDCITLWHVLEHLQDPFKYAAEISRLLKPGGICITAHPNCSSFDARYYKESWAAWDVPRHLWHFTPETFRLFSEKAGFTVSKIISLPPDVFYISALSERYRESKFPFISGFVKGMGFLLRSLFKTAGSSSLIYILKKRS